MSAVSRQEYVKRYQSSEKPKKKLKDTAASSSNGRGMRLLDEDTFIQQKGRDKLHRKMAEEEDGDDDFDEDEEELDEIEQAIRRLNRKSSTKNSKKNNGNPGPAFKTDSFVDVQGDDLMEQPGISAPTASDRVKTEVKEELQSEGEEEDQRSKKKGNRMGDGRRTGLVSKQVMVEEIQQNDKKEAGGDGGQQSESTAPAETRKRVTGFNRDARKRRKEDETEDQVAEKEARKAREAAKQTELEQKYASWNRGVAQIRERADRLEDMEQTLGEGFARYADNQAMNEKLREQLHDDDPMADYFRLKNHKVQMRTGVVYPTYKGQVPPNRYGIQPGYRWDGVDRSNGFESKMALEKNKQKAHAELTYRSIHECE